MGKPPDSFPKNGKSRAQKPAQGQFPEDPACGESCHASQPKVPAADGKAGVKKGTQQPRKKQQVAQDRIPGTQGPQKAVQNSQQ